MRVKLPSLGEWGSRLLKLTLLGHFVLDRATDYTVFPSVLWSRFWRRRRHRSSRCRPTTGR